MVQVRRLFLYLLPLALVIAMVVLFVPRVGVDPANYESALIGKALPKFSKRNLLNIESIITEQDLQGPALINVFGSWCPACYHEHRYLMELAANSDITIYGLNYKDELDKALEFIEQQGNPYDEILFDENGRLGIDLGVTGAPETFAINAENRIVFRKVGVISEGIWINQIQPALAKSNSADSTNSVEEGSE